MSLLPPRQFSCGEDNTKVHLDGYNFLPRWKGETDEGPRREFFYFSDTGNLLNLRYNKWKVVFEEQRVHGFDVWQEPFPPCQKPGSFSIDQVLEKLQKGTGNN